MHVGDCWFALDDAAFKIVVHIVVGAAVVHIVVGAAADVFVAIV